MHPKAESNISQVPIGFSSNIQVSKKFKASTIFKDIKKSNVPETESSTFRKNNLQLYLILTSPHGIREGSSLITKTIRKNVQSFPFSLSFSKKTTVRTYASPFYYHHKSYPATVLYHFLYSRFTFFQEVLPTFSRYLMQLNAVKWKTNSNSFHRKVLQVAWPLQWWVFPVGTMWSGGCIVCLRLRDKMHTSLKIRNMWRKIWRYRSRGHSRLHHLRIVGSQFRFMWKVLVNVRKSHPRSV